MEKYDELIIQNFSDHTQECIRKRATEKGIPVGRAKYELEHSAPWLFPQGRNPEIKTFTAKQVEDAGEKLDQKARSLMLMSARPMTYSQALYEAMREHKDLAEIAIAIPVDENE